MSSADVETPAATSSGRTTAGSLGGSLIVSIGLGYVLTVACQRLLSPPDYAVFVTFWGLVMGLGSTLSPLEQELSRQSAVAALTGGKAGRPALRAVAVGMLVAAAFSLALLIPPVNEKLFHGDWSLAVIVLCGGVAFACQFGTRGLLIGQHKVKAFSLLVVAEPAIRALVLGVLVVSVAYNVVSLAVAVAAGSFAWLLFARPARQLLDVHVEGDGWGVTGRRMGMLLVGAALTAAVITGYPALVGLLAPGGDGDRVGALFAALVIARLPLTLIGPVQSLAVPFVVRLSVTEEGRHRLRRVLALGAAAALVLAALGALVGLWLGPWAVRFVSGPKYDIDGWSVAGLVWSSVLLVPMQLLTAVLVARTQARLVLLTWAIVTGTASLMLVLLPGDTVFRAVVALAAAPTLGLAVVLAFVLRKAPETVSGTTPGTGETSS
ncbi:lipopolysaccharide biosynthesis protein [Amycolatopsis lexingtonensis]|uniref:lipopolysaccharide biosynthesis protein n=1 Tax=Amycolatopsis lexingtonensis TaxID=218822 RepID=UPI003F718932